MHSTVAGNFAPISAIIANQVARDAAPTKTSEGAVRHVAARAHIFFQGDKRDKIYEVTEGVVCVYTLMADGRRQVISFCYPGSLLGLSQDDTYLFNAEALSPVKLKSYAAGALEKLASERSDLSQALFSFMMAELRAARDQMITLGRKSAPEKIASFLLDLIRHNEDAGENPEVLDLLMTRSDIGDYLGLTIETVSRNFTKLKAQGIIELHHKTTVIIRDMARLEELAAGDDDCVALVPRAA